MGRVFTSATNNKMDINKLKLDKINLKFHHFGYVCESIDLYKEQFLCFSKDNDFSLVFDDYEQNVKACFIKLTNNILVELLEVLDIEKYSPIQGFVKKNKSGYHHICYETDNFDKTVTNLKSKNFRLVSKTSNGFENREVSFFIPKKTPDGPLIEIVSKNHI
tara:strand:- start:507 stop:992 length:486 start_codon:yes stop_codon:yes gene_type:complete